MLNDYFLTAAEIARLTGKKYAPAQKRVLQARKIRFIEDASGRPVVLRVAVERALVPAASGARAVEPTFSVFPALQPAKPRKDAKRGRRMR